MFESPMSSIKIEWDKFGVNSGWDVWHSSHSLKKHSPFSFSLLHSHTRVQLKNGYFNCQHIAAENPDIGAVLLEDEKKVETSDVLLLGRTMVQMRDTKSSRLYSTKFLFSFFLF